MYIEFVFVGVVVEDRCVCECGSVFGSLFGGKKMLNKEEVDARFSSFASERRKKGEWIMIMIMVYVMS